jgi:hypothetical protein
LQDAAKTAAEREKMGAVVEAVTDHFWHHGPHNSCIFMPHCCCCCLQDAAKTAAEKMGAAADAVTGHAQFPEFPPQEGEGVTTMHPKKAAEVSIIPSCAERPIALKRIHYNLSHDMVSLLKR